MSRYAQGCFADLVSGEVDEEADVSLEVLAAVEPDAVPHQLQRGVDERQQRDGDDVPESRSSRRSTPNVS